MNDPRNYVFVDIETTGLDVEQHEIIEIAVITVEPRGLAEVSSFNTKVRPEHLETASPMALALTRYSAEDWADACSELSAVQAVWPLLRGGCIAGHGVHFDIRFLQAAGALWGMEPLDMGYHALDTSCLLHPLLGSGDLTSISLVNACEALKIEHVDPHRALSDVRAALALARHFWGV